MKGVGLVCSGDRGCLRFISAVEGRFQGRMDTVRSGGIRRCRGLPCRVVKGKGFKRRRGA